MLLISGSTIIISYSWKGCENMSIKTHELKIYPQYFNAVIDGTKTFELRKNDRGFEVEDFIQLKEFDNINYSGRTAFAKILYILDDKFIGLEKGYCILGIKLYEVNKTEQN